MIMNNSETLSSLAMLRVHAEHGLDYFDYEAAIELVALLGKLNAKLAVFEHTVEEVNHVLLHAERVLSDPTKPTHPMIASLRREEFTVADMALARGTLDRFFENHKIVRMLAPGYTKDFQIDHSLLKGAIEKEKFDYPERALENDINSIRSIFELRRNKHPYRLEDAIAVLVTNNPVLAQAAYKYGQQYESGREVSTVITDFSLANVAWLKAPLASPDLPRLELIAECYATMEPSPKLWSMYGRWRNTTAAGNDSKVTARATGKRRWSHRHCWSAQNCCPTSPPRSSAVSTHGTFFTATCGTEREAYVSSGVAYENERQNIESR